MGRGWEGVALRMMRGRDFEFTVTAVEDVTAHCRRLRFADGGMLDATGVHPTMWVRLWFPNAGRPHQRAYTLVDPDPDGASFGVDFALHDGPASRWAGAATVGDTLQATVQGSAFAAPAPTPARMFLVGDRASAPAIASLLHALPDVPATVWLETQHDSDRHLPAARTGRDHHDVRLVPREDAGAHLANRVRTALPELLGDPAEAYVWIACDTATTRDLARFVRRDLAVPKSRTHALGYWRA
ncbi:siderophore-interacting protein [Kitasatospora sp. NPDC096077]|uniref:siderophore-interacting protein n=1 Tax=Kitasatospora sp. NPDC096077 TaxID=3155544 RepID=UPI0033275EF4